MHKNPSPAKPSYEKKLNLTHKWCFKLSFIKQIIHIGILNHFALNVLVRLVMDYNLQITDHGIKIFSLKIQFYKETEK